MGGTSRDIRALFLARCTFSTEIVNTVARLVTYISLFAHVLVLCVDAKSKVQALNRVQPSLPLRPTQTERRSQDNGWRGATSLFAALGVKTGKVIGHCYPRYRVNEFRCFLNKI